jgi:hypothetical protein
MGIHDCLLNIITTTFHIWRPSSSSSTSNSTLGQATRDPLKFGLHKNIMKGEGYRKNIKVFNSEVLCAESSLDEQGPAN